ncbi:hypothetical protein [Kaarinaea lacus]
MTALQQLLVLLFCGWFSVALQAADRREYQHGVEFVPLPDGRYWLLWSSSPGDPPDGDEIVITKDGDKCKYFTHDIYYTLVDPENPVVEKKPLIVLPEAQEPVSAAINKEQFILVTFEDGSDSDIENCDGIIQQRYKMFDSSLHSVSGLNKVTINGGHSGHVTSVGNYFVIAYAEGWIEGGGSDDAGSANDIYVDVINAHGQPVYHRGIAVDKGSPRDWWPLIAGSGQYATLVWQRYVDESGYANLMYAIYDPQSNKLVKEISLLKANLVYYHYDVQYLSGIKRFLIVGNYVGDTLLHKIGKVFSVVSPKAFAYLLDEQGNIVDQWDASVDCENCETYFNHPIVRESQPAIHEGGDIVKVLYPTKPKGLIAFNITASKIEMHDYIDGDHYWFPLGVDGIFLNENTAYFVNLTQQGLKTSIYKLP